MFEFRSISPIERSITNDISFASSYCVLFLQPDIMAKDWMLAYHNAVSLHTSVFNKGKVSLHHFTFAFSYRIPASPRLNSNFIYRRIGPSSQSRTLVILGFCRKNALVQQVLLRTQSTLLVALDSSHYVAASKLRSACILFIIWIVSIHILAVAACIYRGLDLSS
jgi:hypothetical protein